MSSSNKNYHIITFGCQANIADSERVAHILEELGFELRVTNYALRITIPTRRMDITLPEDLIEEIVRIYGYDKIPTKTLSLEIPKNIIHRFAVDYLLFVTTADLCSGVVILEQIFKR